MTTIRSTWADQNLKRYGARSESSIAASPKVLPRIINQVGNRAKTQVVRARTRQTGPPRKTIVRAIGAPRALPQEVQGSGNVRFTDLRGARGGLSHASHRGLLAFGWDTDARRRCADGACLGLPDRHLRDVDQRPHIRDHRSAVQSERTVGVTTSIHSIVPLGSGRAELFAFLLDTAFSFGCVSMGLRGVFMKIAFAARVRPAGGR